MKCPVDGQTLVMAERHSVEIDYCPECRGIWLDRGELDRIVENAAPKASPAPRRYDDDRDRRDDQRYDDRYEHKPAKKKSRFSAFTELLGGDD
jgi:Zn-finger nucleic acid-binding protein